jgi:hypothetical protein
MQLREVVASPATSSALGRFYAALFLPAPQRVRVHPELFRCHPYRHQSPHHDSIAPGSAWNQLIEVDGFGTDDWVTPSSPTAGLGNSGSLGQPQVQVASSTAPDANGETPGVISITAPAATLGGRWPAGLARVPGHN